MALYSWYDNQRSQQSKNKNIKNKLQKKKHLTHCSSWPTAEIILNNKQPSNFISKQNYNTFFTIQEIYWQNLLFEK